MTDLADLIARLEGATEGSRELDCLIWLAAAPPEGTGAMGLTLAEAAAQYSDSLEQVANWWRGMLPAVSTSLDAALGLAARVLPGWFWQISGPWAVSGDYEVRLSNFGTGLMVTTQQPTPALALCLAILKAVRDKEED